MKVCVRVLMIVVLVVSAAMLGGCGGDERSASPSDVSGAIAPPAEPDPPKLDTPLDAVDSYTDWISYAYRVMSSDIATHAFSPYEEVNVNSYVQYNLMENRGIEQSLQKRNYRVLTSSKTTATVVGDESWLYRYFVADESRYLTGPLEATYDVTYTVVFAKDRGWLVDKVQVSRLDTPTSGPGAPGSDGD